MLTWPKEYLKTALIIAEDIEDIYVSMKLKSCLKKFKDNKRCECCIF